MAPRTVSVTLVVCLLVVSGCSTLVGPDTERVETETLTPVPVSTDEATPTPAPVPQSESFPPGVSPNGTVAVDRLVSAHQSVLAERTYRWEFSFSVAGVSGPFDSNYTRVVTVGDGAFTVNQTSPGLSADQTLFVTNGTGYLRSVSNQAARFQTVEQPGDHHSLAFAGAALERFLTGVTVEVTSVETDGETYYRLHAAGDEVPPPLRQEDSGIRAYTVTAYVTSEGFVQTMAVRYERLGSRGDSQVSARYDYTQLSGVTVERPDWVSRLSEAGSESGESETAPDTPVAGNRTVSPTSESATG